MTLNDLERHNGSDFAILRPRYTGRPDGPVTVDGGTQRRVARRLEPSGRRVGRRLDPTPGGVGSCNAAFMLNSLRFSSNYCT